MQVDELLERYLYSWPKEEWDIRRGLGPETPEKGSPGMNTNVSASIGESPH